MERVAILGAGIMGHGIAQSLAQAKRQVTLYDIDTGALDKALAKIERSLRKLVEKGIVSEPADTVQARIQCTESLQDAVGEAEFVIEAVPERLELKLEIFGELDRLTHSTAVLATNTSELSVTHIAAATERPERVIGMHWFNPVAIMRLVEVVRAIQTSDETLETTLALANACGKETVVVKDSQGFVTTRILGALLTEAVQIYEEGVASTEDIDQAVKLGLNHPMGPFELLDLTGIDTNLLVQESLTKAFGERFRASQTVRKLVEAGRLGRKSGHGFYRYDERGKRVSE